MNIRAQAAKTLAPVFLQQASLDSTIAKQVDAITASDRALYKALCYGVCRHYYSLQTVYQNAVAKPLKNKDTDVKALIFLGIYQLFYLRTPDHAAINETVNAVKALKKNWAVKFINGVLRQLKRDKTGVAETLEQSPHHDHPTWFYEQVQKDWPQQWQAILDNNNLQAPMTLRVNSQEGSREAYGERLKTLNLPFVECKHSKDGLTLASPVDVMELPGFADGACSVQDEAAQLAGHLLNLASGHHILDACCAPGGKTCHIAEQMDATSTLVALDIDEQRLTRVQENLSRLKLRAELRTAPAQNTESWWDGKFFDRILLDAPCSATGVIRRHPDIKLLRRKNDIEQLSQLQLQLLKALWACLAPGGTLLYATCSVLTTENEKVVAAFVETQADAIHLPIDADWGVERPYGRQLFPQKDGHDGFYYARISKR